MSVALVSSLCSQPLGRRSMLAEDAIKAAVNDYRSKVANASA